MSSPWLLLLVCFGSALESTCFNIKIDCEVSEANGGEQCSNLKDTKTERKLRTLQLTANLFSQNFLGRPGILHKPNSSSRKSRDLLILMDSSGSIGSSQFTKALNNLAELLGLLCPSPDPFKNSEIGNHQAAFIQFSDRPKEEFFFGQRYPTYVLKNAIRNVRYIGGMTCTGDAFKAAMDLFSSKNKGVRNNPHVQKQVLILTDGQSNCGRNAIQAASDLKAARFSSSNDKVEVFGLMIGVNTTGGLKEVTQYASNPTSNYKLSSFNDLGKMVQFVKDYAAKNKCFDQNFV